MPDGRQWAMVPLEIPLLFHSHFHVEGKGGDEEGEEVTELPDTLFMTAVFFL